MKKRKLYALPVTLVMMHASPLVLSQSVPELDITITVLEEGQTPAGFIQQLELPPVEIFGAGQAEATSSIGVDDQAVPAASGQAALQLDAEIADLTEAATDTIANTLRETISIDGTATLATESATLIPAAIVDVLDAELPLEDSLETVLNPDLDGIVNNLPPLDDISGGLGDIMDNLGGGIVTGVDDVAGAVDDVIDNVTGGVGDVVGGVTGGVGDVVGGVTDGVGDVVGGVTDGVGDVIGGLTGGVGDAVGGLSNVVDGVTDVVPLPGLTDLVDNLGSPLGELVPLVDKLADTLPDLGPGLLNTDALLQGAADIRTGLPLVEESSIENLVDEVAGGTLNALDTASPELPATDLLETLSRDLPDLLP